MSYRTLVRLLMTVPLLVGLAGCAGPNPTLPGVGDSGTAAVLDRSASITVQQPGLPTNLDPHRLTSPRGDLGFLAPLYEQLLRLDENLEVVPQLASSYEMSADGLTLSLQLRDDVKFQDGTEFDSAVVLANLERARTLKGSTAATTLTNVASWKAPDPRTVVLHFTQPSYSFPYKLAYEFGASAMISGKAIDDGVDLSNTPVGSGKFTLFLFSRDRAVFKRSDNYWNPKDLAAVQTATVVGLPDLNARLSALQSGQLDSVFVNPNERAAYQPLIDSQRFTRLVCGGEIVGLFLNPSAPELADVRVRRALSMAIDRKALSQALFGDDATPAFQVYSPGVVGHLDEADKDPYNPAAAKRLLAEAGVPTLTLPAITTMREINISIATILQAQLAEIGVTLNVQKQAGAEPQRVFIGGGSPMLITSFFSQGEPSVFVERQVLGPYNPSKGPDTTIAAAEAATNFALDDPDRVAAFENLTRTLQNDVLAVPIVRIPQAILTNKKVQLLDQSALAAFSQADIRVAVATAQ